MLKKSNIDESNKKLFKTLFKTWCFDPITALSLTLLSQQYSVACIIIKILCHTQLDVDMLLQLSQLVKLINMPHYAMMRMQLLRHDKNNYIELIRALKGLLMLLPQGEAFESLKLRIQCANLFEMGKNEDHESSKSVVEVNESGFKYMSSAENEEMRDMFIEANRDILPLQILEF